MTSTLDPLRFTSDPSTTECHQEIQEILQRRISITELPEAHFYPAIGFDGKLHTDLYGQMPVGLYVLPNAAVIGAYRLVLTESGAILREQNAGIYTDLELMRAYCSTPLGCTDGGEMEVMEDIISLTSACCYCFYHWMMDSLPKVVLAEMTGYTGQYLVPPAVMTRWVEESMALLGIDPARIVRSGKNIVRTERLYIPTYFSGFNNRSHREIITEYRRRMLERIRPENHKRLFIPRKPSAALRRITNHEEVSHFLGTHGFYETYFEDHSLTEQIALAAGAESLVAPHGSGMVHTLFMKPKSTVIELFPYSNVDSCGCYHSTMELLGHRYYWPSSSQNCGSDIYVDTAQLQSILEGEVEPYDFLCSPSTPPRL
ncbi:MAG: glycosyltransferase family 61 protein [Deltaproteobacteria bacterium]|nr:glycosyltransferase family 61 protein [Deltaproteobacteria bacterium]